MRALAFDIGLKRIGLAVTDPFMMIATPLTTLSPAQIGDYLAEYLSKEQVSNFVIGRPLNMDGSDSESANLVNQFKEWLMKTWPQITISEIDERLTSVMAQKSIIASGIKKQARRDKSMVDSTAAALILQTWLLQRQNNIL